MKIALSLAISGLFLAAAGCAEKAAEANAAAGGEPAKGRLLFVEKGCVICHAANGVGGKAAPALDAADDFTRSDPLEFAARMWRGAPAMVEFQSVELGYVIDLTGEDIAHLSAFAASRAEQKLLLETAIPGPMRDSLLDERYWEMEDWSEFMADGQEGYGDPAAPTEPDAAEAPPQPPK